MFVLPWMLLSRGSSPQVAALAGAFVYVPMLVTALPAGAWSDALDPLRLMRIVTAVSLAACALYPLASLAGQEWFGLVLVAAVVVGAMRNLDGGRALPRARRHDPGHRPAPRARDPDDRQPGGALQHRVHRAAPLQGGRRRSRARRHLPPLRRRACDPRDRAGARPRARPGPARPRPDGRRDRLAARERAAAEDLLGHLLVERVRRRRGRADARRAPRAHGHGRASGERDVHRRRDRRRHADAPARPRPPGAATGR